MQVRLFFHSQTAMIFDILLQKHHYQEEIIPESKPLPTLTYLQNDDNPHTIKSCTALALHHLVLKSENKKNSLKELLHCNISKYCAAQRIPFVQRTKYPIKIMG